MTINPTAHADAILSWMESQFGTVSRDELRSRIEQEVRDVARRAYEDAAVVCDAAQEYTTNYSAHVEPGDLARDIRALKAGL